MTLPVRPLALVTGASSGIGFELARQLVQGGHDVLVNAEDDGIVDAANQLSAAHEPDVHPVQADLSTAQGVEQVYAAVRGTGRPLDAAALNARVGLGSRFVEEELSRVLELVDLNVRSTTHLAHLVLRDMVTRGRGRVLLTSSIAATMPGSHQAVYNASKSYVQSLATALQDELRDSPVTVTALMPGPTATHFFARAGLLDTVVGRARKDDPADVARQGYEALMDGERRAVAASLMTKAMSVSNKVLPDDLKALQHRWMARPRR
jgi:short-subunit dehydrogenase